jgi:hypothetical protein
MNIALHPISPGVDMFLGRQIRVQNHAYTENHPGVELHPILLDGQPTGPLHVPGLGDEIRAMDISLLSQYRSQGSGTHLLKGIVDEGGESNRFVTIYIGKFNPNIHL